MKKKVFKRKTRQGLIAGLLIMLALALAGLCWSLVRPLEMEEEYQAFSYRQDANIDYLVGLHPNGLYDEAQLAPGRAYITSLVNTIDANFTYRFSAKQEAEISGEYSIIAVMGATAGTESSALWEKSFVLHPPQAFSAAGKEFTLQESVSIPFSHYYAYANEIIEMSGFNPDGLTLNVYYDVKLSADTPGGQAEETSMLQMTVPLRSKVFTVGGNLEEQKSGDLTATKTTAAPYYEETRLGFGLFAVLLVLLLIITLQVTTAKEEKNRIIGQRVRRLFRRYQERIVKCTGAMPDLDQQYVLAVGSFDDMLRAADELEKPILYFSIREKGEETGHSFFVISEQYIFRYNLGEPPNLPAGNLSRKHAARFST